MNPNSINATDNRFEVLVTDADNAETLYESEEDYEATKAISAVFEEDDEIIEEDEDAVED